MDKFNNKCKFMKILPFTIHFSEKQGKSTILGHDGGGGGFKMEVYLAF